MKKILFASTALAGLAIGGAASAEIALFGSARLGIGYNIDNEGVADLETSRSVGAVNEDGDPVDADGAVVDPLLGNVQDQIVTLQKGTEDLRAISRIRWGVTMTGESDSGITFGASIRADNADGGGTGDSAASGQVDGDVFVSGAWGTLTYGDTNAADEQHVGDASGQYSVTGLGDFNETPFISNGGGFGDDSIQFADNADARPTVRYDYNFGGFGISGSTNRNLNDIGVGASYTVEFAQGSVTGGVGYYDFNEFTTTSFLTDEDVRVKGGEQFSVGLTGVFGGFSAGVVYTAASSESDGDLASGDLDVLNVGGAYTFDAWTVGAYYATVLTGNGTLDAFDDSDSYGASVQYDLGGGATVNFGVAQTYGRDSVGTPNTFDADGDRTPFVGEVDSATVADFGIKMDF